MDVVIPLGGEQNYNHEELRYTLRSLEKYMQDLGRIFIVGKMPSWAQNLEHIDCHDQGPDPVKNVMRKIEAACMDSRVSADFLLSHDDTFSLSHFTGENLPFYARQKGRGGIATQINFAVHCPIRINKEMWNKLFPQGTYPAGMSPRSFYCNFYSAEATEIKSNVIAAADQPHEIEAALKGQPFGVVNNRAFGHPEFLAFIRARYPEVSQFERA